MAVYWDEYLFASCKVMGTMREREEESDFSLTLPYSQKKTNENISVTNSAQYVSIACQTAI